MDARDRGNDAKALEALPAGERVKRRYSRASVFSPPTLGRSAAFLFLGIALLVWDKGFGTMPEVLTREIYLGVSIANHFYLGFIGAFFFGGPFHWAQIADGMPDADRRATELEDDAPRDLRRALLILAQAFGLILLVTGVAGYFSAISGGDEYVEAALSLMVFLAIFPVAAAVLRFLAACWRLLRHGRVALRLHRAPMREGATLDATFDGGEEFSGRSVRFSLQCLEERKPQTWGTISRKGDWPRRTWGVSWAAECDLAGRARIKLDVPVSGNASPGRRWRNWSWELCVEREDRRGRQRVIGLPVEDAPPAPPDPGLVPPNSADAGAEPR